MLQLFGLTMGILLAPKFLGLVLALLDAPVRRAAGGAGWLVLSFLFEIVLSALIAPIAMLIQSGSVFEILAGRDTGWNPQRRGDGSIPFPDIVRRHRWHTALGLITGIAAFAIATSLFLWMSPTILGLVLAIAISWASGRLAYGLALKRAGLLLTPEEHAVPAIVRRAEALSARNAARNLDEIDALEAVHTDADFARAHAAMLPAPVQRPRGAIDAERTLAAAKIAEADTLGEARAWLGPKERMALLHDRDLIERLARLRAA